LNPTLGFPELLLIFIKAHGKLTQCCTGFERKAVCSEITFKNPKGGQSISSHPIAKSAIGWATRILLLADAEFPNDSFIALGIVSLEVVEQATPFTDQHKQAAARAVVLLVRFEVIRQLANAFTDDGDLNLRTPGVSRVRLILVNDRFLLLSG
jgi:hypothetical protein